MTSIELLARLAALLPPPRYPLTRYHGVLAPRSAWRREIVPRAPASSVEDGAAVAANRRCSPSPSAGARDRPWQAAGVSLSNDDILDCAKCHGRLRVVATIAEVRDARRILERLGVPSDAPQAARARDPTYVDDEQHTSP